MSRTCKTKGNKLRNLNKFPSHESKFKLSKAPKSNSPISKTQHNITVKTKKISGNKPTITEYKTVSVQTYPSDLSDKTTQTENTKSKVYFSLIENPETNPMNPVELELVTEAREQKEQ